jgi:hypothetical protein
MTNKQSSMPGGMTESPTTAESLGPTRRATGSRELALLEAAAQWGAGNKPSDARTRAQAKQKLTTQTAKKKTYYGPVTAGQKGMSRTNSSEGQTSSPVVGGTDTGEGLDRPVAGGDWLKEAKASSVNQDVGDRKSLDRPNEGGGQGTLDRPAETGGDQGSGVCQEPQAGPPSKGETVRGVETQPTPQIVHSNNTELSTPAINTSDASTNEIEGLSETVDNNPDEPAATMTGKSPERSEGQPDLKVVTQSEEIPRQVEQAVQSTPKPSKSVTGTDQTDREKPIKREFLKPKVTSPPEWMEFKAPERVLYCRRFPDTEIRSEIIRPEPLSTTRRVVMGKGMPDQDLKGTIKYWRDLTEIKTNRTITQKDTVGLEPKDERTNNEEVVHVGVMSARDADIDSDVALPRRNRSVGWLAHGTMVNKLSAINYQKSKTDR